MMPLIDGNACHACTRREPEGSTPVCCAEHNYRPLCPECDRPLCLVCNPNPCPACYPGYEPMSDATKKKLTYFFLKTLPSDIYKREIIKRGGELGNMVLNDLISSFSDGSLEQTLDAAVNVEETTPEQPADNASPDGGTPVPIQAPRLQENAGDQPSSSSDGPQGQNQNNGSVTKRRKRRNFDHV